MRLARRPGVRLSPAALPASPAPAPAPAGGSAGGEDVQHRARREPFFPPLSPLITGHRSEDGRAARNKRSLISTAGLRRDAGRLGRGQPRGAEPCRAALPAPHRGGTRRHPRREDVLPRAHSGRPRGRLWGGRSSPQRYADASGSRPGRAAGRRGRGASGGGGRSGRGTAAVCPLPRRRATLVQIAPCHLPDGNHHPPLQKSRQPGTAASLVVHGNRRI